MAWPCDGRHRPGDLAEPCGSIRKIGRANQRAALAAAGKCAPAAAGCRFNPTSRVIGPQGVPNTRQIGLTFEGNETQWFRPATTLGRPSDMSYWASCALAAPATIFVSSPMASTTSALSSLTSKSSIVLTTWKAICRDTLSTTTPRAFPDRPITAETSWLGTLGSLRYTFCRWTSQLSAVLKTCTTESMNGLM